MKQTPVYRIPYLEPSDPLRLIADIDATQAAAIEQALRQRGVTPTSSELLDLVERIGAIEQQGERAVGIVGLGANRSISSSSQTRLDLTSEIELENAELDSGGVRVLLDGDYDVTIDLQGVQAGDAIWHSLYVLVNGVQVAFYSLTTTSGRFFLGTTRDLTLAANDVVTIEVASGSTATPRTYYADRTRLSVRRRAAGGAEVHIPSLDGIPDRVDELEDQTADLEAARITHEGQITDLTGRVDTIETGNVTRDQSISQLVADAAAADQRLDAVDQDTGWRDLTALVVDYSSGNASMRRIGSTVELAINDLRFTTDKTGEILRIPSPFRPQTSIRIATSQFWTHNYPTAAQIASGSGIMQLSALAPIPAGRSVTFHTTFITTNPMSAPYPGTPM